MSKIIGETRLYYNRGRSDKVYNIYLNRVGIKYTVYACYGRRGSKLIKTNIEYFNYRESANVHYNAMVSSKLTKGYEIKMGAEKKSKPRKKYIKKPPKIQLVNI